MRVRVSPTRDRKFEKKMLFPRDITQTGWWTALIHPFEQGWTLQNYQQVIGSNGMGEAFLNSLAFRFRPVACSVSRIKRSSITMFVRTDVYSYS